jgi:hypothetical protein
VDTLREQIRQWLLLVVGFSGIVYETFWEHADRPTLLALYGSMVCVSQVDRGLAALQEFAMAWVANRASRQKERAPTLGISDGSASPKDASPQASSTGFDTLTS